MWSEIASLQFHTNYPKPNYQQTTPPTFIDLNTELISIRFGIYFTFSYLNLKFPGIKFNVQEKKKPKCLSLSHLQKKLAFKSLCFRTLSDYRYWVLVMVNFVLFFRNDTYNCWVHQCF